MRKYYLAPALVDVSITNRCNLSCDFCYASSGKNLSRGELSKERLLDLFEEADKYRVHRLSLTGGEPLIREDFFEVLDGFCKYKFATIINTNGTLIDDSVAKKLKKYSIDRICVSLDGSTESKHDSIRGKSSFKKTISGILNLQRNGLPVSTLFTLHNENVEDLISVIKLNEEIGINYLSVMVICPTGRAAGKKLTLSEDKWYPIFNQLTDMKKNGEIKLNFKIVPPNESEIFWLYYFPLKFYNRLDDLKYWNQPLSNKFEKKEREVSCQAGLRACSIAYNGDVYGCDLMMNIPEFCAGNIRNRTLIDIWNNSQVFKKLREMECSDFKGKCANCKHIWCGGGCRSTAYNCTGDILGSDEVCFYKEG